MLHITLRRTCALLAIAALSSCGGSSDTTSIATLASVSVTVAPSTIIVGQTATGTATGTDAAGKVIALGAVTWTSSAPSVATVSGTGVVTAVAAGQVTITATSGGKQGSAPLSVLAIANTVSDFAITGAQFTQGVQVADGSIPIVLDGNAAVVNVLVKASAPRSTAMQLVLRLFDAAGVLVRSDTVVATATSDVTPSWESPSAQFLVPASVLKAGLRWEVVRDPKGLVPDDTAANDVFPRAGRTPLSVVSVPPLNVRFVPITLAANGNATGAVNAGNLSQYLRTLKSVHPLGVVNAHVGPGMVTNTNFGTAPSGGAAAFWQQVLAELDLARVADPIEPDANWYGVVVPPTGFNNTIFGGFSYIPTNPANTGAGTRTSVAVQVNWFNNPTQARDLVAHEIGHTFGRSHAPCGAAGAPLDAAYPVSGGKLEQAGHDVFAWANGLANSAATIPATTGDLMGYCNPVWASSYTYRAVLAFRGNTVLASRAAAPVTRALVVRGSVTNGTSIALEPAFTLDARPTDATTGGDYTMEALNDLGRVLISVPFTPFVLDHAADVRPFTIAIPSTPALETNLASIRVRGPAGTQRLDRRLAGGNVTMNEPLPSLQRDASGTITARCAESSSRGIVVLRADGSVLGSARSASLQIPVDVGGGLSVVCSDGVRSVRGSVVVR